MKFGMLMTATAVSFGLFFGAVNAGELKNSKSGKTVTNQGLPGEGEIKGTGIANGTATPSSSESFPCGDCGFGPGSPDITTNKTYKNAGEVIEFNN